MSTVLVTHPHWGSVWLSDAYLVKTPQGDYVLGYAWDDGDAGDPHMPDDYTGQDVLMNFPATCIRKRDGELHYKETA